MTWNQTQVLQDLETISQKPILHYFYHLTEMKNSDKHNLSVQYRCMKQGLNWVEVRMSFCIVPEVWARTFTEDILADIWCLFQSRQVLKNRQNRAPVSHVPRFSGSAPDRVGEAGPLLQKGQGRKEGSSLHTLPSSCSISYCFKQKRHLLKRKDFCSFIITYHLFFPLII